MNWTERARLERLLRRHQPIQDIPSALLLNDTHHHLTPLLRQAPSPICSDVTVVIPTHRQIPVGLGQWVQQSSQVHILNNGLSDDAIEQLTHSHVQIRNVTWNGHGRTRQEALAEVETPFVLFSVDDAIPLRGCIQQLKDTLETGEWDAVVARQIPFPTAERWTRDQLGQWMPPAKSAYPFPQTDHVATLYRTEMLQEYPIPSVPIAEDAWWSSGKRIACDPKAVVVHSHPRHLRTLMHREYQIHRQWKQIGDCTHRLTLFEALLGGIWTIPKYGIREGGRVMGQNLARFAAHKL